MWAEPPVAQFIRLLKWNFNSLLTPDSLLVSERRLAGSGGRCFCSFLRNMSHRWQDMTG